MLLGLEAQKMIFQQEKKKKAGVAELWQRELLEIHLILPSTDFVSLQRALETGWILSCL